MNQNSSDNERLRVLYKEAATSLEEASQIIKRQVGKAQAEPAAITVTLRYGLGKRRNADESETSKEERYILKVICDAGFCLLDEHGVCVGVYDEKQGVCRPC